MAVAITKTNGFDYSQLLVPDRIVVKQKTTEILDLVKTTSESIVKIGQRLIEVKSHLPHGQFSAWLDCEFGWTDRTAQRMMQVAEYVREIKTDKLSDLTAAPSALYLLASPSTPASVQKSIGKKVASGKPVTHADVKKAITSENVNRLSTSNNENQKVKSDNLSVLKSDDDIPVDAEPATPSPPAKATKPEPTKDKLGTIIEDDEIAAIFRREAAGEIAEILKNISAAKVTIEKGILKNDELFGRYSRNFHHGIKITYDTIKGHAPYALCPFCHGAKRITQDCAGGCNSTGWMTYLEYQHAIKQLGGKR